MCANCHLYYFHNQNPDKYEIAVKFLGGCHEEKTLNELQ